MVDNTEFDSDVRPSDEGRIADFDSDVRASDQGSVAGSVADSFAASYPDTDPELDPVEAETQVTDGGGESGQARAGGWHEEFDSTVEGAPEEFAETVNQAEVGEFDETLITPTSDEGPALPKRKVKTKRRSHSLPSDVQAVLDEDPQQRLGPYVIVKKLGEGGMGVVLEGFDPRLRRRVAIKKIRGGVSKDDLRRFEREARITAQLKHPGIAGIYEVVTEGDQAPYLVMDYVPGITLHALCQQEQLKGRRAAELLRDVARAIAFAHEQGIVHRDLKPHNVMVTPEGKAVVLDFGLARQVSDESMALTRSGVILGTPAYMAPEQVARSKDVGPEADVYGLGAILFELLTQEPPVKGETLVKVLAAVVQVDPPSIRGLNPLVHRDLETICMTCLAKSPAKRYASAADLAEDLDRFLEGEPVLARRVPTLVRYVNRVWRQQARGLSVALALALLVLIPLGIYWVGRAESASEEAQVQTEQANVGRAKAEAERAEAKVETAAAKAAREREERARAALQKAVAALEQLSGVLRYRYRPKLPTAEEERLVNGARARVAAVMKDLNALITANPNLPGLHVITGRAWLELSDQDRASASAERALAIDAEHGGAWLLKAQALVLETTLDELRTDVDAAARAKRVAEARTCFEKAAAQGAQAPPLVRVWSLITLEKFGTAGDLLDEIEQTAPSEETSFARAILVYRRLRRVTPAQLRTEILPHYQSALRYCPRMPAALFARGAVMRLLEKPQAAFADFSEAVRLKPDFFLAWNELGNLDAVAGRFAAALEHYARAIQVKPGYVVAHNGRGWALLNLGRVREAIAAYDASIELEPTALGLSNRALAYSRVGQIDRAIADYRAAIKVDPTYVGSYLNLGLITYRHKKDRAGAIAIYSKAIEIKPDYRDAYLNRALVKQDFDVSGALADCAKAIEIDPNFHSAYNIRAGIYVQLEQIDLALADLDKQIELNPDAERAHGLKAHLYLQRGDMKGAGRSLEQVLRIRPKHPQGAQFRALVRKTLGRASKY